MSMANGAQVPLIDSEENRRIVKVVKNFVGEKLRRRGINVPGYDIEDTNSDNNICEIAATLRRVGDELELADTTFIENMCDQLQITPHTALYPMFQGISDQIFASGKNWGRIVAFLTFGSSLAIHCANRPELGYGYVDRVVEWIYIYMTTKLSPWMNQHNGWNGFMDFFDRNQRPSNGSTQNGFIVSALAGVGLGAILMMTFK